jgi:hypothetical protein
MADSLDMVLFDLGEVLSDEHHVELVERVKLATELATVEAILRMSFKAPDGGSEIRRRVFEASADARSLRRK